MQHNTTMRAMLIRTGSALALAACTTVATAAPAAARTWGWHHGWGWGGALAAGVIGGALAAATSPFWAPGYYDYYYPNYAFGQPYAYGPTYTYRTYAYEPGAAGGIAYCEAHFRSYNPATETYLGYDGRYHHCP